VVIPPRTSDERLLELVRAGEERAFEIVVRRYRPSLVGYCMRLGLSESRAEDAVQQTLLSALLALRRGDEVRDLRAWLGRIAHNVSVNLMRAGSFRRESGFGAHGEIEQLAIHIPDMDGGIAAREALAEVAALPAMQREALLQSALGGRSYGEVALSMGVSEGAVRGLLHRARLSLRSAAAIFSPLPLIRRVSGWLGGGSPSAGRVLELTAPGASSGLNSTAVRAIGAGITAIVVAAGVAVGPLDRSAHHKTRVADVDGPAPASTPSAPSGASAHDGPLAIPTSASSKGLDSTVARSSLAGPAAGSSVALTGGLGRIIAHVQRPSPGSSPRRQPGPGSATPTPTEAGTRGSSSGSAQASSAGAGTAAGSVTVTQPSSPKSTETTPVEVKPPPTHEEQRSDDGSEKHGDSEDSGKSDQSEHEEEAREREAAAEKAEREREHDSGKDN